MLPVWYAPLMQQQGDTRRTRRRRRDTIAAAVLLAASAVFVSSGAASAPDPEPAPSLAAVATAKAYPPAECAHPGPHDEVQAIGWDEVSRLASLGLPVCDVAWVFADPGADHWGYTFPYTDVDDRPLIIIDADPATYGTKLVEQDIRTTVRHEFGHAVVYLLGYPEYTLRAMFDAELTGKRVTEHTQPGLEASGDAIAQALTPAGQDRTWFYDEVVDADDVTAARALLDEIRAYNDETPPPSREG